MLGFHTNHASFSLSLTYLYIHPFNQQVFIMYGGTDGKIRKIYVDVLSSQSFMSNEGEKYNINTQKCNPCLPEASLNLSAYWEWLAGAPQIHILGSEALLSTYPDPCYSWSPLLPGFSCSMMKPPLFCGSFKEDINSSLPQFPLDTHSHKVFISRTDFNQDLGVGGWSTAWLHSKWMWKHTWIFMILEVHSTIEFLIGLSCLFNTQPSITSLVPPFSTSFPPPVFPFPQLLRSKQPTTPITNTMNSKQIPLFFHGAWPLFCLFGFLKTLIHSEWHFLPQKAYLCIIWNKDIFYPKRNSVAIC